MKLRDLIKEAKFAETASLEFKITDDDLDDKLRTYLRKGRYDFDPMVVRDGTYFTVYGVDDKLIKYLKKFKIEFELINEMFGSADLDAGLLWDETPSDVKDSHTGEQSKLPIDTSILKKKKKKKKLKIQRRK
jgi:hypothetical protein